MDTLRGQLLIAPPHLTDPNFSEAVVLMIQHDEQGAFGLVLNRPSSQSIADIWSQVHGDPCASKAPLHVGGPVTGPLVVLHQRENCADVEVVTGVYCSTRPEMLDEIVQQEEPHTRFFAGYAGWAGGQLEGELQTGSWLTVPASAQHVFSVTTRSLWKNVFKEIVDDTSFPGSGGPATTDPSLN